jgi:hypothetical protein
MHICIWFSTFSVKLIVSSILAVYNVKKERRTFLKEKKQWPYYICMVVCVDIPLIFCCISCLVVDNIVLDFVSE